MIYCNKRKKDIKPEVGQVWKLSTVNGLTKDLVKIIHICKKDRTYPILIENPDGSVSGISKKGGHKYPGLLLDVLIEESPKPPSPWRPIETAPKDGTEVVVFDNIKDRVHIYLWNNRTGYWERQSDTIQVSELSLDGSFTHWMPLPDAPKTEERDD